MAARCANIAGGATCGAKKQHPIHLRITPNHHEYLDSTKAGLKPVSDARAAYQQSAAHKDAMALSAGATSCWPAAYGAPGECFGKITPSHTLSRSKAGGLAGADRYPVPPACARHNAGLQDDAEMRAWGEVTLFTVGNRQYPFLITDAYLQAEKERRI